MPRTKKQASDLGEFVYLKAEDLPEDKRRMYHLILEDFDKQVEARIEEELATARALQAQVRSAYQMALLQLPKDIRMSKFEDMVQNRQENRLSVQLEALKHGITSEITSKVESIKSKQQRTTSKKCTSTVKKRGKASTDIAELSTAVRKSSRYRNVKETPAASASRARTAMQSGMFTPAQNPLHMGLPVITPKFNMATPLHRSVMRTAKPHETLVSLSGSPVYVAPTAGRGNAKKNTESAAISKPMAVCEMLLGSGSPSVDDVDIDEESGQQLKALRSRLDNMLLKASK